MKIIIAPNLKKKDNLFLFLKKKYLVEGISIFISDYLFFICGLCSIVFTNLVLALVAWSSEIYIDIL